MKNYVLSFILQSTVAAFTPYIQMIFRNMGYSQTIIGTIIAILQLASIFGPMLVSGWADNYGKEKTVLIFVSIGLVLFSSLTIFVPRSFAGIITFVFSYICYSCMNPICDGYFSKVTGGSAEKYGKIRASGTLGYIVTLVLVALIGFPKETDNKQIFIAYSFFSCLLITVSLFAEKTTSNNRKQGVKIFAFRQLNRRFYVLIFCLAVFRIALAVIDLFLPSFIIEDMGLGKSFTLLLALGAFGEMFLLVFAGKLVEKKILSTFTMFLLGPIGLFLRLTIYWMFPTLPGIISGQLLHAFCFGAAHLGSTTIIASLVEEEKRSTAMSLYWSLGYNLPCMIGSLMTGIILDNFGYITLFKIVSVFPLLSLVFCLCFNQFIYPKSSRS